jgi:hypothetical protein
VVLVAEVEEDRQQHQKEYYHRNLFEAEGGGGWGGCRAGQRVGNEVRERHATACIQRHVSNGMLRRSSAPKEAESCPCVCVYVYVCVCVFQVYQVYDPCQSPLSIVL